MTIIVVGNAALDTTFEVDHLPRPGESILVRAMREDLGGKGLNQAVAASRAGARVAFCAAIGEDAAADAIMAYLAAEGIDADAVLRKPGITDRTTVFVMPDAENALATSAHNATSLTPADVAAAVNRVVPGDVVLMQGNLALKTTLATARTARARGATVVLNPSPITCDFSTVWPFIDIVVANADECATLTETPDTEQGARRLLGTGVDAVVVTRGANDVILLEQDSVVHVEVPSVVAVDTTGAGDAFCGVFVAAVASGSSPLGAVQRAVEAAAIAVTRAGAIASIPRREELVSATP
jgi:ribokinase